MHFALGSPFALYKLFAEVSTKQTDGEKHEFKRNTDENGCKLTSQKAAIKAKEVAMRKVQEDLDRIKKPIERKTFSEAYNKYVEKGRNGKAYQTFGNG